MSRYLKALILALGIYIVVIIIYIYATSNNNLKNQSIKQSFQRVKVTILTPQPAQKKIKKVVKAKKIIKSEIKKTKPILKKKIVQKKMQEVKQVIKKQLKNVKNKKNKPKKIKKFIPKQQMKQSISKVKVGINKNNTKLLELKKQKYYKLVKYTITENKKYPRKAIRRGIQGSVNVKFTISPNGDLLNLQIIDGKKLFYKSVKKAIKNSFPIVTPKMVFKNEFDLKLKIVYMLK